MASQRYLVFEKGKHYPLLEVNVILHIAKHCPDLSVINMIGMEIEEISYREKGG